MMDSSLPPHLRGALHGIRVVEFARGTTTLAGALVGRMLADAGASVTVVHPPPPPQTHQNTRNIQKDTQKDTQNIQKDIQNIQNTERHYHDNTGRIDPHIAQNSGQNIAQNSDQNTDPDLGQNLAQNVHDTHATDRNIDRNIDRKNEDFPAEAAAAAKRDDGGALAFLLSRGKRRVSLDLQSARGRAAARALCSSCDVVVENFSPGVMARHGLGADQVREELNPRVVYLSLPGFGTADAGQAHLKAYEGIVMARVGVFADMGLNRTLMGVNPSYSPLPLASAYGAALGALGVCLALLAREAHPGSGGRGDALEVPLGAALCDALVFNSMDVPALPARYVTMREIEIAARRERGGGGGGPDGGSCSDGSGNEMNLTYPQIKELLDPFYHTYACADGRPFYVVAPCHALHQKRCLQALGIWEDMLRAGIPEGDVYAESEDWRDAAGNQVNMILGTYPITDPVWIVRLKEAMKRAFLKRPALEWEKIFMAMKITGAATRTTKEWLHSEHAQASGLVQARPWGADKVVLEAGPVVWQLPSKVPGSEATRQATREVARRAFLRRPAGDSGTGGGTGGDSGTGGGWLAGTRVVDLCNVIAGPTIGGMLARYGATVIKVDPAKPTYDALVAVFMGVPINTGKRSLLANIKAGGGGGGGVGGAAGAGAAAAAATGKEILRRLVRWGDVVLVNQTSAQLRSLGIDEASLKAINPHVILSQFDAFGGPHHGPRSDAVGYDDLLQASTGIMARFGGGLDRPEEHAHLGTVDVVSGFLGALSVVMVLFKRLRTGQADTARASLAAAAQLIQAPFMYDVTCARTGRGLKRFDEPSGPHAMGEHALYRWYPTPQGGHVFVAAPPEGTPEFRAACAALGRQGAAMRSWGAQQNDAGRVAAVERLIADTCASEADAVALFARCNISRVPLTSMAQLREGNGSAQTSFRLPSPKKASKVFWPSPRQSQPGADREGATFHFNKVDPHPIGGHVEMFAPCSLLSREQAVPVPSPAPRYGEHSREILKDVLGFSEDEIASMVARGVVADGWSSNGKYIPEGDPWANVKEEYAEMIGRIEAKL